MDLFLTGRRVLITGATGGIGRAVSHCFAAQGCSLILLGRSSELLSELRTEIAALNPIPIATRAINLSATGTAQIRSQNT